MSFFSKIFNRDKRKDSQNGANDVKFGRFAAPIETDELYELRVSADELYEQGKFLDAYITYFNYLQSLGGPAVELSLDSGDNTLTFRLLQGSKIVRGLITESEVFAECVLARVSELNVALMRFLLKKNCDLAYSKFSLFEDSVVLKQRCPIKDMSTSAFASMLSEIALVSDRYDELLENEFPNVIPIDYENVVTLKRDEVKTKIEYLRFWLKEAFDLIAVTEKEARKNYIILSVVLKILYLISPEGALLNKFRAVIAISSTLSSEEDNLNEVNYKMLEALHKIYELSDTEIEKSIYKTYSLFPELEYQSFVEMADSINTLMQLPLKCIELRQDNLIIVMCEYIAGLHLYQHGMPAVATELLLIFWRVLNSEFFYGIGFHDTLYNENVQKFAEDRIIEEIDAINRKYSERYPGFAFDITNVDFGSLEDFSYTFLIEFKNLQITE